MKFADLPQVVVKDWLTPQELDAWYNHPTGEMCFGIWKAQGRFLWHYRGDDFPTDAVPGSCWYDASGDLHHFMQNKTWVNVSKIWGKK